jgi:hypothetical protein
LAPLLEASKTADQVYANGYFERHYPEADKKMKSLLHDKVMAAWSNSDNDDEEHEERSLGTGLNITINVGG